MSNLEKNQQNKVVELTLQNLVDYPMNKLITLVDA